MRRPTTATTARSSVSSGKNNAFKQSTGRDHLGSRRRVLPPAAAAGRANRPAAHICRVTLPSDDYFKDGGWVSCALLCARRLRHRRSPTPSCGRTPRAFRRSTAAPALRGLQFPVVAGPAAPERRLRHAQDRGGRLRRRVCEDRARDAAGQLRTSSAKKPTACILQKDIGVRLGWDDEQILIWQNRQMLSDPATPGQAYRRPARCLLLPRRRSRERRARLALAGSRPEQGGAYAGGMSSRGCGHEDRDGRAGLPTKINADPATTYWLPSYFTQWYGPSLVLPDARAAAFDASGFLADPGSTTTTYSRETRSERRPVRAGAV